MPKKNKLEVVINATDKASAKIDKAAGSLEELGQAAAGLAVVGVAKAAYELSKLGAQSLRTKDAFEKISGGAELATANLEAMQVATRGAMSEQEMMASANQLLQMGLAENSQELGTLTDMAMRLGAAMGRDASESMESFALMLANQSIPRLDTFGISASKVRARIEELMKANADMSRETAFMTATMEQGNIALDRLGDSVDDEMLAFEQTEATLQNLKATWGELIAGPMSDMIEVGNEGLNTLQQLVTWNQQITDALNLHATEVEDLGWSYEEYIAEMNRAVEATGRVINEEGDLVQIMLEVDAATGTVLSETENLIQADFALSKVQYELKEHLATTSGVITDYGTNLDYATRNTVIMKTATDETADSLYNLEASSRQVAGAFGEMHFDDTELWNLALASGASLESLAELAEIMGIAREDEIAHTLEVYRLVDAFGAGTLGADDLADGYHDVSYESTILATKAKETDREVGNLSTGMQEGADTTWVLGEAIGDLSENMAHALNLALSLGEAIRDIPEVPGEQPVGGGRGRVQTHEAYQHGGVARGGLAWVGERGPELLNLPAGTHVYANNSPQVQGAGSKTVIIAPVMVDPDLMGASGDWDWGGIAQQISQSEELLGMEI